MKTWMCMQATPADFRSHFSVYNSKFYNLPLEIRSSLYPEELRLLKEYGLPDRALPFFNFDLHLHLLRENKIPGCRLILGSGRYVGSSDYIFLHENGTVYYKEKRLPPNYINGSIEQLIDSIYIYSAWLKELEKRTETIQNYNMSEEDIFDVYYELRSIDKKAVCGHHVWNCLIQFKKPQDDYFTSSSL